MNDSFHVVLWFVVWIIVFCAFVGLFTNAYGDYYRTMGVLHKYNPQVCVMLPEERAEEISAITNAAISEWENKLIDATGGNWYFFIFEYDWNEHWNKSVDDYPLCTIFINFPYGQDDTSVGRTGYDFSSSARYYFWIEVDLNTIEKQIHIDIGESINVLNEKVWKQIPDNDLTNIVRHEFGHGLGIEHYYVTTDCRVTECDYSPIMYKNISLFEGEEKFVSEKDIEIMVKLYGEDGFGGLKPHTQRNVQFD